MDSIRAINEHQIAHDQWRLLQPNDRSARLAELALALDERRERILALATMDTGLTADELLPEFARMTGTLRMFADASARDATWNREIRVPQASDPASVVGPNHAMMARLMPLGLVAVFGASNFPLAYGAVGGDTGSALAAGCGVIVKEHPAHRSLGRELAEIARSRVPLLYVPHEDADDLSIARHIVQHPLVRAVGFTGSTQGGLAVAELARARTRARGGQQLADPIPVFAEMGSCNQIVVCEGALRTRGERIMQDIAQSLLLRHGQQCTAPGIVWLCGSADVAARAIEALAQLIAQAPLRRMLAPHIASMYVRRVEKVLATGEVRARTPWSNMQTGVQTRAVLLETTLDGFVGCATLQEEIFGPALLVGRVEDGRALPMGDGALTYTIIADEAEQHGVAGQRFREALQRGEALAGRIIINGVPTGVRVCDAMVHGGPFPATTAPPTTAVGLRAMERWCRMVCWQGWSTPAFTPTRA